ncbi:MAG: hypothetical protein AABW67_01605 [Nanoarchaeota archaeon]
MPKKHKSKSGFRKSIKKLERQADKLDDEFDISKNIEKEEKEVEDWVKARRKFLIKLGWVAGLIIVLLLVSHFYLSG